jgi:hypothetical protein
LKWDRGYPLQNPSICFGFKAFGSPDAAMLDTAAVIIEIAAQRFRAVD